MKQLGRVLRIIDLMNERVGRVTSFVLLGMMFIISFEVIARYVFNAPTIWAEEINEGFFIVMAALGGGYVLLHKGHIVVDMLYSRLGVRGKAIIDLLTSALFFIFIFVLLRTGLESAIDSISVREHSNTIFAMPLYPLWALVPIGALLLLLQGLAKFIRDFVVAIGKGPLEQDKSLVSDVHEGSTGPV